jgi:hypothetical protein
MAGGQERILRRRIKSVQSTKKITRAMELIAATRVVQAQERTRKARPYAEQITNVILDLAGAGASTNHPLLAEREAGGKAAFVVVTSDRGLAGAYNSAVIRAAEREIQAARTEGLDYSLFVVGKKALTYFRFRGYKIDHVFLGKTDRPSYEDAREIGQAVGAAFEAGELASSTPASSPPAARRSWSAASCRSRSTTATPRATTCGPTSSSSRPPTASSTSWCPATSRPASTPPSWTPRPRSTPPGSGP